MLSLLPYDYNSEELAALQLKWENDFNLRHLFCYYPDEEAYKKLSTLEELKTRWAQEKTRPQVSRYSIQVHGQVIGEVSFSLGHPCCHNKDPQAAWLGIVIGELTAQGCGYGTETMRQIELLAYSKGATRMDLGVFEFNKKAIRLYEKCGYTIHNEIPNFTWWDGRLWSDFRMSKELSGIDTIHIV